jgi:ribosomal protein L37E
VVLLSFYVFRCKRCGRHLYARSSSKTRKCVCGYTNELTKILVLAKAEDERTAAELVRRKQGDGTGFTRLR